MCVLLLKKCFKYSQKKEELREKERCQSFQLRIICAIHLFSVILQRSNTNVVYYGSFPLFQKVRF